MKITNTYPPQTLRFKVLMMICLSAGLGLAGCQPEGPAEKAGQKIDKATEHAEKKIELLSEKAETKIEAAKEVIEQKADVVKDSIDESTDASKANLDAAGKKLEQATDNAENKVESVKEAVLDKAKSAGEYLDDAAITATVKAVIAADTIFKASHIEVTTVDGIVKLSGTVDSEPVLGRVMEVVSAQKHVKSVQSTLVVSTSASSKQ
ncbi:MAG: BON domain-containing protein [Methylococcales bacterium]